MNSCLTLDSLQELWCVSHFPKHTAMVEGAVGPSAAAPRTVLHVWSLPISTFATFVMSQGKCKTRKHRWFSRSVSMRNFSHSVFLNPNANKSNFFTDVVYLLPLGGKGSFKVCKLSVYISAPSHYLHSEKTRVYRHQRLRTGSAFKGLMKTGKTLKGYADGLREIEIRKRCNQAACIPKCGLNFSPRQSSI